MNHPNNIQPDPEVIEEETEDKDYGGKDEPSLGYWRDDDNYYAHLEAFDDGTDY